MEHNRKTIHQTIAFFLLLVACLFGVDIKADTNLEYRDFDSDKKIDTWFSEARILASKTGNDLVLVQASDMNNQNEFVLGIFESKVLTWDKRVEVQLLAIPSKESNSPETLVLRLLANDKLNQLSSKSDFFAELKNQYFCAKFGKGDLRCDVDHLKKNEERVELMKYCLKKYKHFDRGYTIDDSVIEPIIALAQVTTLALAFLGNAEAGRIIDGLGHYRHEKNAAESNDPDEECQFILKDKRRDK